MASSVSVSRTLKIASAAVLASGLVLAPTAVAEEVAPASSSDAAGEAAPADVVAPDAENPAPEDPAPENPDAENPDAENPDAENPDAENPDAENPDAENPDAENPDAENPDAENPDAENPDAENPDTEDPDTEDPDTEDPASEEPAEDVVSLPVDPVLDADATLSYTSTDLDDAAIQAVHRQGCIVTFTVALKEAGTYTIEVWDDGEMIGSPSVTGEAGSVHTLTYMMGADVGAEAVGYDFHLTSDRGDVQKVVNWDFEGSGSVMKQCSAAASAKKVAAGKELAKTGTDSVWLGLAALALIGAGSAAVYSRRALA